MNDDTEYPRLEGQITWYDTKSTFHRKAYKRFKIASIMAAACVPLAAGLGWHAAFPGALGVVVVISEGLLQLNQHHENWIRYRATCESLQHEKYRYLLRTGIYDLPDTDAFKLLADRIEGLISQESSVWIDMRRSVEKSAPTESTSIDT